MVHIGFLYNHDHVHQIAHSATVAFELSRLAPACKISLITSSQSQFEYLKRLEQDELAHGCVYTGISIPRWIAMAGAVFDKTLPVTRVANLAANLDLFKSLDVLVAPEKTCLLLRTRFGLDRLKFVYTAHGAGDREIGFDPQLSGFDLIFLPGLKVEKRMRETGLLRSAESCVVGYPKFDAFHAYTRPAPRLFTNDRLTVLYNPHFSPSLSSWFSMGVSILDYFYNNDRYNLIFAPHVMLYRRRLHIAPDRWRFGRAIPLPRHYYECPHIHIDMGSTACTDMTYTLAADIYLGDVSSQVWEFLIRPRPCLFANAHRVDWERDPNYLHWRTGHVFDDSKAIDESLLQARASHPAYYPVQQQLFADTFAIDEHRSSSRRAAEAILGFVDRHISGTPPRPAANE